MSASETRLYHHLQLAAHSLKKHADQALVEAAGLSTAQVAVLAVVAAHAPVSQKQVAEALGLNESAMTAMANRLLASGLLTRSRDAEDGRAWQLGLSAAGRDALAQAAETFQPINGQIDEILDPEEMALLVDMLRRLYTAFGRA